MELRPEQQRYAILKAVEQKLVSAVKLDPETKGTGILRMKRGANVSDEVISRRYQNLVTQIGEEAIARLLQDCPDKENSQELPKTAREGKSPAKQMPSQVKPVEPAKPKGEEMQARIAKLEARIAELERENQELKEKLEDMSKEPMKMQGWSLIQRKAGGGEHKYWYAGKSKGGKMRWIYLGKELDLKAARVKIEAEEGK